MDRYIARRSNHLSIHQWVRSATHDSQQTTCPIGFLLWTSATALCGTTGNTFIAHIITWNRAGLDAVDSWNPSSFVSSHLPATLSLAQWCCPDVSGAGKCVEKSLGQICFHHLPSAMSPWHISQILRFCHDKAGEDKQSIIFIDASTHALKR